MNSGSTDSRAFGSTDDVAFRRRVAFVYLACAILFGVLLWTNSIAATVMLPWVIGVFMIVGGIAYALTFDWVAANILPVGAYGKLRLPELLGLPELAQDEAVGAFFNEVDQTMAARRDAVWAPYHAQLRAELDRIRAQHGVAVLWDAHSIRSVLPRFFEGKLPDLNLGTADGESCNPALAQELLSIAQQATGYTAVLNGRFKGGHITRHYGQPEQGVHAIQLEMTQCSYMQEALPFDYLPEVAALVQPHLQRMLTAALAFATSASKA